jgi:hypothetical protein
MCLRFASTSFISFMRVMRFMHVIPLHSIKFSPLHSSHSYQFNPFHSSPSSRSYHFVSFQIISKSRQTDAKRVYKRARKHGDVVRVVCPAPESVIVAVTDAASSNSSKQSNQSDADDSDADEDDDSEDGSENDSENDDDSDADDEDADDEDDEDDQPPQTRIAARIIYKTPAEARAALKKLNGATLLGAKRVTAKLLSSKVQYRARSYNNGIFHTQKITSNSKN